MSGARYFVTCSAVRPESRLVHSSYARLILETVKDMVTDKDIILYCATVMPDHVHLLFSLPETLELSKVIGKFKTLSRKSRAGFDMHWQANYFEHRLRPDELCNDYARYIFLNPYRAGLIERRMEWPYWIFGADVDFNFLCFLEEGKYPPIEWLAADIEKLGLKNDFVGND
jgi:REP element-mobilizing transposase RayT